MLTTCSTPSTLHQYSLPFALHVAAVRLPALQLDAPDIRLALRKGRLELERASGVLNGGRLELTGNLDRDGVLELQAEVTDARLRLDLGARGA